VVALVKPQFEAGREDVPRGGVVREPATWRRVLETIAASAAGIGLYPWHLIRSPITGGDGNVEFLMEMRTDPDGPPLAAELDVAVAGTHTA
jgi:23S rRNA (cytidine1920-2'-O)/16S rRNA (cytidine1409-2'-O)-methyltransferase